VGRHAEERGDTGPGGRGGSGVDPASAAALRILFGALLAVAVVRYFANGWIEAQYERPTYFFAHEGFEWIRPLPAPWMRVLFAGLGVAALLVALGLFYRVAIVLFALGFTWVHLCDRAIYLNHYWLVSLLAGLMACLPLHAAWSLDARRRPELRRTAFPGWGLGALRFQVGLVYVFAGLAKLQPDWLLRGEPLHTWLAASEGLPLVGAWAGERGFAVALSWLAAAFDLAVPFLVLWPRTRVPAFLALVGFHALTAWLFPIGLFPVFMTAFATILLAPSWPRRFLPARFAAPEPRAEPLPPRASTRALLGAWAALQIALPLRCLALPDDVLWAERGFRFSWRVMLTDKSGTATFRLRDPATGAAWEERPEAHLTPHQARQMAGQPDMLLQFARFLAARARAAGHPHVEVRVETLVAMNGRPGRAIVDPTRDVARGDAWPEGWTTSPP
jgi:hypothetical protein